MKKIQFNCHDCEAELTIQDKFEVIDESALIYCPFCGSDNTEVPE